ncbi:Myb-like protein L [Sesamum alatum]|uniref:Myb-like protein L n=1 Tax=Sesamum alatum TaxID=300844 RepID=A0AAE1XMR5_9LAMI|nr:Myb-like protein L [Sesamum alatum]
MPSRNEEFSDTDSDDGFNEDMEALKKACQLTEKNHIDHQLQLPSTTEVSSGSASEEAESDGEGEGEGEAEGEDDLQLVRSIQKRFAVSMDMEEEPLTMKPLCTLPPDWSDNDDCEDDYETLRAIQRRFAAFSDGGLKDNLEDFVHRPVQVGATIIDSEKETSDSFTERTNAREGFLNCVDRSEPTGQKSEACDDTGRLPSDLVEWKGTGVEDVVGLPLNSSHFPKSAVAFVDAIKKNRSCQKLIRSKMMQMEARIEELKKLMELVKILRDFQVACKKRTGRALSQKKDARVQLISVPKLRANTKLNDQKIPAVYKGPPENLQVAYYKEALATFAVSVSRVKWSKEESENLVKGVRQQFQGMLLQRSVDLLSEADGSYDSSNVDSIMLSIKDVDITPEKIRLFLPKVNWEQLAAMYVPGRSGAECQARFLNFEDPLINHNPWTAMEDKNLLHIVQQKGLSNWIDIAASLTTNRTPSQCLARYQRSLNASILKREWTKEEDNQLRSAVETFGESNWQVVASVMEGRTGTQCSNRWLKTLHPARQRVGKWTAEEDKRLKVAVTLFGPRMWKKVARCVPGRTQVQCRERWVNCLDPSLNMSKWTEEEDSKLETAIAQHGYCWSKVAACIPHRTDNQCWRRWKVLFPSEVPLHQAARKIQKAALISNFVDRESEKPALGPSDFVLPEPHRITGSENVDPSRRKKRRSRWRKADELPEKDAPSGDICSEQAPRLTNGSEVDHAQGRSMRMKGRGKNSRSAKKVADSSSYSDLSRCPDTDVKPESVDGAPADGAISQGERATEPDSEQYEHANPTEECLLPTPKYPNLPRITMAAELGGHDATRNTKVSKLQPRRRRGKTVGGVPETLPKQVGDATISKTNKKMVKEKKKQNDATNDHVSSFPDSTSLLDIRKGMEAAGRIKARNRKRTEEICASSRCVSLAVDDRSVDLAPAHLQTNTDVHGNGSLEVLGYNSSLNQVEVIPDQHVRSNGASAVLGNLHDSAISSESNSELQHNENAIMLSEIEADNITLGQFLVESGADRTQFSSAKVDKLLRKVKKTSQVQSNSRAANISVSNQLKRRRLRNGTETSVEGGSRKEDEACTTQVLEAEVGDDTTLANFYNKGYQSSRDPKLRPPLKILWHLQRWSSNLEASSGRRLTLSKVNQKNFISLLGYCKEEEPLTRMMDFEYALNGTLFEHLHNYSSNVSNFVFWDEGAAAEKQSSPQSKVYNFCVMLLEMVTGKLPYSAGSDSSEDWASGNQERQLRQIAMSIPTLDKDRL